MRLFLHEVRTEQLLFWRNREAAFFTFFLPIIFFLIFGSIYGNSTITKEHIRAAPFLEAGMIGYGVASTAFAGLAITMVIRRESGVLKRIRATPLPPATYLARRARLDVRRLPDRGGADHRDRPAALLASPFPTGRSRCSLALAARRASLRGDGARADRRRALRRRLVGGRQLRLPADGDHLRARSSRRRTTRRSCGRSPTCCR